MALFYHKVEASKCLIVKLGQYELYVFQIYVIDFLSVKEAPGNS